MQQKAAKVVVSEEDKKIKEVKDMFLVPNYIGSKNCTLSNNRDFCEPQFDTKGFVAIHTGT